MIHFCLHFSSRFERGGIYFFGSACYQSAFFHIKDAGISSPVFLFCKNVYVFDRLCYVKGRSRRLCISIF